jgi:hypothetical protein
MAFKRGLILFAAFWLAALSSAAKPNFSGEWKLNASKSTFGPMPAPSSMTYKITHDDPKLTTNLKQSSDMGEFSFDANYTTDGKECTNQGFGGNPVTSVLKWDGDTLIITSKGKFGDNEFTGEEKWVLADDGKTLNLSRVFKSAMGQAEQKLVLEKQ